MLQGVPKLQHVKREFDYLRAPGLHRCIVYNLEHPVVLFSMMSPSFHLQNMYINMISFLHLPHHFIYISLISIIISLSLIFLNICSLKLTSCSCSFSSCSLTLIVSCLEPNVGELLINRYSVIVQTWSLKNNASCAHHHRHREDPQKQTIKNHCYIFPVFLGL